MRTLDILQKGLAALGMVPAVGEIFDVLNAGISVARGNYSDAALNLASAVPGLGNAVAGAKMAGASFALVKMQRTTTTSLKSFSHASEYGIQSYNVLQKQIRGTGLEAHHLIEQRFATALGQKARSTPSIALTKAEHQTFTNAWRNQIPYNSSRSALKTSTATPADIQRAARNVYRDHPEILRALGY